MSGWSAVVFPQFLHKRKGFFINDGRMCVFEYLPFFLWLFHTFLVFKRFCRPTEIDGISNIFLPWQYICDNTGTPVKRYGSKLTVVSPYAAPIFCRGHYLCGFQFLCYLCRSKACHTHIKNLTDYLCRRLVNNPFFWIFWILHISIGRVACEGDACHSFIAYYIPNFLACVLGVPFVE